MMVFNLCPPVSEIINFQVNLIFSTNVKIKFHIFSNNIQFISTKLVEYLNVFIRITNIECATLLLYMSGFIHTLLNKNKLWLCILQYSRHCNIANDINRRSYTARISQIENHQRVRI